VPPELDVATALVHGWCHPSVLAIEVWKLVSIPLKEA
jgi:hypothetical protein